MSNRPGGRLIANLDWSKCPAVESVPAGLDGPGYSRALVCLWQRSLRISRILSVDEAMKQFDVTREQVEAVLEFVAESLRFEVPTGARPV